MPSPVRGPTPPKQLLAPFIRPSIAFHFAAALLDLLHNTQIGLVTHPKVEVDEGGDGRLEKGAGQSGGGGRRLD